MWSQFAEKPFENLVNIELKAMATDQVAEAVLGYDAFADPEESHEIWAYLGLDRPKGIVLDPSHWSGATLPKQSQIGPNVSTSLILQYKRCEYMQRPNAGQSALWEHQRYFRFRVTNLQQTILATLENNLGAHAAVRYVAPAFHRYDELAEHHANGTGIAHSGFVAPGGLQGHRYWTYQCPGTIGIANPPVELPFENFEELRLKLVESARATPRVAVREAAHAMVATAMAVASGELEPNRADIGEKDAAAMAGKSLNDPRLEGDPDRVDRARVSAEIEQLFDTPRPPSELDVDVESLVSLRQAMTAASILGVDWMLCLAQRPEPPAA